MSYHSEVVTTDYTVTVAAKTSSHTWYNQGSSNAYYIDGSEAPALTTSASSVLRFDQSYSSNGGHPLRFYTSADKTTEYTTGVTTVGTPGSSGAYTQSSVSSSTPATLHYQCSNHAYMGHTLANSSYTAPSSSSSSSSYGGSSGGTGGTVSLSGVHYYQDHNGKYIEAYTQFTDRFGNQYPANWIEKLTEYQRLKAGIIYSPPHIRPYNRTFRHGPDDFKNRDDVASGLLEDAKERRDSLLADTQVHLDAFAVSGTAIPSGVSAHRALAELAYDLRVAQISGETTTAGLEKLYSSGIYAFPTTYTG